MREENELLKTLEQVHVRGGAGISKVVRPLQIKDHLSMCTGGSTAGNVQQ